MLNKSEFQTWSHLRGGLAGSDLEVSTMVRLRDAIQEDLLWIGGEMRPGDSDYMWKAHLDFVVWSRSTRKAVFAVEFDGPRHDDPIQRRRDIRKNRICTFGWLPLLRVTASDLIEDDGLNTVRYFAKRVKAWFTYGEGQQARLLEEYSNLPEEEREADRLGDVYLLPPEFDARWQMQFSEPLPGMRKLTKYLWNRYRINTGYVTQSAGQRYLMTFRSRTPEMVGFHLVNTEQHDLLDLRDRQRGSFGPGDAVHSVTVTEPILYWLPLDEEYDPAEEPPAMYTRRTGRQCVTEHGLPGVSVNDVGEMMAEYRAMKKMAAWAEDNLEPVPNS